MLDDEAGAVEKEKQDEKENMHGRIWESKNTGFMCDHEKK
jgi:hypothetical protein